MYIYSCRLFKYGSHFLGKQAHNNIQKSETQAAANNMPAQQGNTASLLTIEDERPQAIAQRKIQQLINSSPQLMQLRAIQQMANNGRLVKNTPIVNPVAQLVKPGDAAPTTKQHLKTRLLIKQRESGITKEHIWNKMYANMKQNMGNPARPVRPHPLADPPTTFQEITYDALNEVLATTPNDTDIALFKNDVLLKGQGRAKGINKVADFYGEIDTITKTWYEAAEQEVLSSGTNKNEDLRDAYGKTTPGGDQIDKASDILLGERPDTGFRDLGAGERSALSESLMTMPVVIKMLKGKLGKEAEGLASPTFITEPNVEESEKLMEGVLDAFKILEELVDPRVLPSKDKHPNFNINPDPEKSFLDGIRGVNKAFRANASPHQKVIRVSNLTRIDTIVHEFGHHIEHYLPAQSWLDIQDLLKMRHAGGNLVPIYPGSKDEEVRKEAAYNANMPATGLYSAKVYDDGSTEVMSMTLEYFSTPENARKMILSDPLQAAIILRIVKPDEFHAYIPQSLRKFLPRGDIRPDLVPKGPKIHPTTQQSLQPASNIGNEDL